MKAVEKREGILEHGKRLNVISDGFLEIISAYPPSKVAIERYFDRFINSTIAQAKVHGVINNILHKVPTIYIPPKSIRSIMVHGDANKEDIQNIIKMKYNLEFANEDESDAVAVCLAYLIDNKLIEWEKPDWKEIKALRKS